MKKPLRAACTTLFFLLAVYSSNAQRFHDAPETPYVQGEMLVQLKPGYTIDEFVEYYPLQAAVTNKGLLSDVMGIYLVGFNNQLITHRDFMKLVYANPGVIQAQNNHYIQEERATMPNDPGIGSQWHHFNNGSGGGVLDADIDSDDAWDITTGGLTALGDTIVVCVVESGGAYYQHPDLLPNFWRNYNEIPNNGIDDDGNGYVDDFDGWNVGGNNDNHGTGTHGTNCMGMAGARGNNNVGVAGANWNVKLMLVSGFSISESSVISAYTYPLKMRKLYNQTNGANGAFVVSTSSSWGIDNANPASYPLWCAFYDTLGAAGILSVAATTNNTANVDVVGDMPTACSSPYMVAVTRTDKSDGQAGGYGSVNIDLGAPGINIYTTSGTNSYTTTTGTSFSCPLTAGVIGLIYSTPCINFMNTVKANPKAGADSVRYALYYGVDVKPSLATITATGGRLNSFNSINYIVQHCVTSPCQNPFNNSAFNLTTTTASIGTGNGGSAVGFWYYTRVQGAPTWDSVYIANDTALITGLTSCTIYEFMTRADCGGSLTSGYSTIGSFTTDGCCLPPTGLAAALLNDTTANFTWNAVTAAVSYNVRFKKTAVAGWTTFNTTSTSLQVDSLDKCSDYEVQVQTDCGSGTTSFTGSVLFATPGCGACLDITYCTSKGNNVNTEWIDLVQLNTINRVSAADGGYINTEESTTLNAGGSYNISLSPGYQATTYSEYFRVWIDFDQDGVFADPGEKVYDSNTGVTTTVNGTVNIPVTATLGSTRMRVSMKYVGFGDTGTPTPCLTFAYGEVEDYCVVIDSATAVQENEALHGYVVYQVFPNPAGESVWFNIYNFKDLTGGKHTYEIFSATGQRVANGQITGKMTKIDVRDMPQGMYFFRLHFAGGIERQGRFVVSR